jgi:hypothetical protein
MATPNNVDGDTTKRSLFFVLEHADDGTWVAVPEYAGEDDKRAHCCGSHSLRLGKVMADAKVSVIMLMKWDLAATIVDFKNDIRELIHDYFNPSVDWQVQWLKLHDLLHEPGDLPGEAYEHGRVREP